MKKLMFAAVMALAITGTVGVAKADQFVDLCVKSDQTPGAEKATVEKTCACAVGKVSAADRPQALAAMKAMADAIASGKPEDMANAMANNAKGMEVMMTAEAMCM